VQVTPRHESKVAELLSTKGYEQLSPTYKVRRIWSDRTKLLDMPLFPGYVFCKIRKEMAGSVLQTYGVVRIVSFGGKIATIPEVELNAIKLVLSSQREVQPSSYWKVGEQLEIQSGPFAGIKGTLLQIKNRWQLVVSIDILMRSVAVTIAAAEAKIIAVSSPQGRSLASSGSSHLPTIPGVGSLPMEQIVKSAVIQ
jgi:transcription antitermination factor NusG